MNGRGDSKRESIQIKFVYSSYANVRKSVKRKDYILSKNILIIASCVRSILQKMYKLRNPKIDKHF